MTAEQMQHILNVCKRLILDASELKRMGLLHEAKFICDAVDALLSDFSVYDILEVSS